MESINQEAYELYEENQSEMERIIGKEDICRCFRCGSLVGKTEAQIFPLDALGRDVWICGWCEDAIL